MYGDYLPAFSRAMLRDNICERCAHYLDIFRHVDLVLHYSATF